MKSDAEILKDLSCRIQRGLQASDWWRCNEVRDNYALYEGTQWLDVDYDRQVANNMPVRTVNRIQPIIDAVTGFQIQNRTAVKLIPRTLEPEQTAYSDLGNDGINWIQDISDYNTNKSSAVSDMLICGIGFLEYKIGYGSEKVYSGTSSDSGDPETERIFPYLMVWDPNVRSKNLQGINWICKAKIVSRDELESLLEREGEEISSEDLSGFNDQRFLEYFDNIGKSDSLGIIYYYQWREKKTFYKVENPFTGFEGDPEDPFTQAVIEMAKVLRSSYHFDPYAESFFIVPSEDLDAVMTGFEALGYTDVDKTKIRKWQYFRAEVAGKKVLSKSKSFSQKGFTIKAMTGKYDEGRQCYYGMIRSLKQPQRLLNQAISDYEGFLRTVPKGGVFIETDAVAGGNMEAFRDTYTKAAQITVLAPGSLSGGKIQPKAAPPIPDGLLQMIDYAGAAMMEVVGLTSDFIGQADSKLMTAQLNSQLVRQGMMVLAPYFDSVSMFTKDDGIIMLDMLRILLENEEGRLIGHITPEGNKVNIPLFEENLSPEYDVVVEEVPATPEERQKTFEKLMELAQVLLNKPEPTDITPIVLEYAPLKGHEINAIKELMKPAEEGEEDPERNELIQSEIEANKAESARDMASAEKYKAEAAQKALETEQGSIQAEVDKDIQAAEYDRVRAMRELQELRQNFNNVEVI